MKLIIAEKPVLGEAIASAIPGYSTKQDGVIYKGDYAIFCAHGHLLTLKDPEDYNAAYKEWSLGQLPIYFKDWQNKIAPDLKGSNVHLVEQIGALLKKADLVINAGDIDDEGQLLIDELLRWHHYTGPTRRLNTNDLSKEALVKALRNMADNKDHVAAGWAAYGREVSDKLFGYNLTRYYTLKNDTLMTVGRVQTPTLGLVVNRDASIDNFVKTIYYELFSELFVDQRLIDAKYEPNSENPNLTDEKFLNQNSLEIRKAKLLSDRLPTIQITKEPVKETAPLPFNLTKLNSYCGKKWGLKPVQVMAITQRLRDTYKAITYNRSNCQYLSDEQFSEAPQILSSVSDNLNMSNQLFDSSIKSRCFNTANISAHTAIIPTSEHFSLDKLSDAERNVYKAICIYYLIQFMPQAEKEKTKLLVNLGNGEKLTAVSSIITKPGYRAILLPESEENELRNSGLSKIAAGNYTGSVKCANIREKETVPPPRYTQASLIEDMSCIAKYVSDPTIKKLLLAKDNGEKGENGSIGTTATRAAVVLRLLETGFISEKKEGKREILISTEKGRSFYKMLPDSIKKPDLTAKWWVIQTDIKSGVSTPDTMAESVLETVSEIIKSGAGQLADAGRYARGAAGVIIGKCPRCGKNIVERGKVFGCEDSNCNFAIYKENRLLASIGKKGITAAAAKTLLSKKRIFLKNCISQKSNKLFDCIMVADFAGKHPAYHLEFESADDQKVYGTCPLCGGNIIKNKYSNYSCTNWKSGCKFIIYATLCGKRLTAQQVSSLLTKHSCAEISGFKSSKTGKPFSASLKMDSAGKIAFVFNEKRRGR